MLLQDSAHQPQPPSWGIVLCWVRMDRAGPASKWRPFLFLPKSRPALERGRFETFPNAIGLGLVRASTDPAFIDAGMAEETTQRRARPLIRLEADGVRSGWYLSSESTLLPSFPRGKSTQPTSGCLPLGFDRAGLATRIPSHPFHVISSRNDDRMPAGSRLWTVSCTTRGEHPAGHLTLFCNTEAIKAGGWDSGSADAVRRGLPSPLSSNWICDSERDAVKQEPRMGVAKQGTRPRGSAVVGQPTKDRCPLVT